MDQLHDITGIAKHPDRKRVGRGYSAGGGSTAGRGNKGQKARTGGNVPAYFEGGQTPLIRRLAKRKGFRSHRKFSVVRINLKDLVKYTDDYKLNIQHLIETSLINPDTKVKILGEGELTGSFQVQAHFISAQARAKIEAQGGKVEIVNS
ncbi:MAG: 50S ribosomal protein L15 [Patescibacteria group bacterium]|jgi:large subunit ribosomal protein L15